MTKNFMFNILGFQKVVENNFLFLCLANYFYANVLILCSIFYFIFSLIYITASFKNMGTRMLIKLKFFPA